MAKIYKVKVPSHSGGGNYKIIAKSESRAKEILCEKLNRNRVPKGTIITKIGLSKGEESTESETPKTKQEPENDSLKSRSTKPSQKTSPPTRTRKKKPISKLDPYQKKLYRQEKQEEKENKELEKCVCLKGLYLNKEDQVKLKSKMNLFDCTLYIEDEDGINLFYIGEESVLTLKRGTKFWLYIDHTTDKVNEKELVNHI